MLSLTEGYLSPCPSLSLSLSALCSLPLSPSNKESLGQITPLQVVTLGPIFPYIWCHDSGRVSPLILVEPWFQLTPRPPWGRDWPRLIFPIALLASNTGHSLVSPHTLLRLSLQSLHSVSLGFSNTPPVWLSLGGSGGRRIPSVVGLGSILSWVSETPSSKSLGPGDP
jgi:hypothetical protein